MNKCKVCGNECSDKATYCGPTCRKSASRSVTNRDASVTDSTSSVTSVTDSSVTSASVTSSVTSPASLDDYYDPDGRNYATRANPHLLNWGKPLSLDQLKSDNLKANRVTIPGDWDYTQSIQRSHDCNELNN